MKKLLIASTALTLLSAPAMAYTATTAELDEMSIQELNRYQLQQLQMTPAVVPTLVSANEDTEPRTYTTTSTPVETPDQVTYASVETDAYKSSEKKMEKASTEKGEYDETKKAYIKTIASIDQADPRFTTLVAALKHADLYETMEGEGPFTVFAPTNAAFEKVDPEVREYLMSDAGKGSLAAILKAHVVSGKMTKADLEASSGTVETISDFSATFDKGEDGNYTVANAQIVKTDVYAGNGVAHVIDTVIIPEAVLQDIQMDMNNSMMAQ